MTLLCELGSHQWLLPLKFPLRNSQGFNFASCYACVVLVHLIALTMLMKLLDYGHPCHANSSFTSHSSEHFSSLIFSVLVSPLLWEINFNSHNDDVKLLSGYINLIRCLVLWITLLPRCHYISNKYCYMR
jgi:hypothetical protein